MLSNIAQAIKDKKIKHQYSSVSPQLTVSVGAVVVKSSQSVVVANVMQKADSLLYQAKNNGRNQYCLTELN
jgi:diguanylate cyclase (GGDEF)-like protein